MTKIGNKFSGRWRIVKMSEWDKKYCDMEVKAFIEIGLHGDGSFQFGLVSCSIDGGIVQREGKDIFDFTFEGNDEYEEVSGDGWMELKKDNTAEGFIRFHQGDDSKFWAKR